MARARVVDNISSSPSIPASRTTPTNTSLHTLHPATAPRGIHQPSVVASPDIHHDKPINMAKARAHYALVTTHSSCIAGNVSQQEAEFYVYTLCAKLDSQKISYVFSSKIK